MLDLNDRLPDHFIATACLLIRLSGRLRRLLRIARDLLHGCGHFIHGRRYLIGFVFLTGDSDAGLFGHRGQLLGRAGDLRYALADAANQFAQADGHGLHAALQLTHFVTARDRYVPAQIALSDACCGPQSLLQRYGDLPGHDPGSKQSDQQCQACNTAQHGAGVGRLAVALGGLQTVQRRDGVQQRFAKTRHDFLIRFSLGLYLLELA